MLKSLHIENIAVIEKSDIELSDGFNVLTGETGAGKSIIIDSINAVLGERTSKDLIRNGCEKAEVTALFCKLCDSSIKTLENNGYEVDENGELLIRRVLSSSGNGFIKINGKPATAAVLREIGKSLINIHGQHDSQGLLNPDNHYKYIDALAQNQDALEKYYNEFKNFNSIRRELDSLLDNRDEQLREIDILKYQINEIESANVREGETQELKKQLKLAQNYEKTVSALNQAYFLLNGNDDEDGAVSLIMNAQKSVMPLDGEFSAVNQKLSDVLVMLEDAVSDIREYTNSVDLSKLDAGEISARLEVYYSLIPKYGRDEKEVLKFYEASKEKLDKITFADNKIDELSSQLETSKNNLIEYGERLSKTRKKTAEQFSKNVTDALKFLDMLDSVFSVNFEKGRYGKTGCDIIEFVIRTNLGEEPKPLHKIASGGELSRIMLAIKSILADKDDVDTLIFDEIDSGISGRAAGKVGSQLTKVANSRQVVCVTHSAQIAAFAESHFLIEKNVNNGRTYTEVKPLDYEEKIEEIARIMSSKDITESLYNSAKELIDRSIKNGNL